MADLGPALVTGSATLVGVVAGAGLTYWLGALNRRHQEAREDKTRWYEARLQAYIKLNHAIDHLTTLLFHPEEPPQEARWEAMEDFRSALSIVHLVGSPDFYEESDALLLLAGRIIQGPRPPKDEDVDLWSRKVLEIEHLAREDLGYPDTLFQPEQLARWVEHGREKRAKKR